MKVRDAAIRGLRTAGTVFVTALGFSAIPAFKSIADIKVAAFAFAFAAAFGFASGVVTFVVCVSEDNTAFQLPK